MKSQSEWRLGISPDSGSTSPVDAVLFGPFCLISAERILLKSAEPVRLGSRALDILIALVERPGELVGKRELMGRVWPSINVVEANLTVQMALLRRALDDGRHGNRYIVNIPGRGYCFVSGVSRRSTARHPRGQAAHVTSLTGWGNAIAKLAASIPGE